MRAILIACLLVMPLMLSCKQHPVQRPIYVPGPQPILTPVPMPVPPAPKQPTQIETLIDAHNQIRQAANRGPLQMNPQLMEIAQRWADHMAQTNNMHHQAMRFGPEWMAMGENIAEGQRSIQEVMQCWMHSPGHKRNILDGTYNSIGVGIAKGRNGNLFWCVDFGRSQKSRFDSIFACIEDSPSLTAGGL